MPLFNLLHNGLAFVLMIFFALGAKRALRITWKASLWIVGFLGIWSFSGFPFYLREGYQLLIWAGFLNGGAWWGWFVVKDLKLVLIDRKRKKIEIPSQKPMRISFFILALLSGCFAVFTLFYDEGATLTFFSIFYLLGLGLIPGFFLGALFALHLKRKWLE